MGTGSGSFSGTGSDAASISTGVFESSSQFPGSAGAAGIGGGGTRGVLAGFFAGLTRLGVGRTSGWRGGATRGDSLRSSTSNFSLP